MRTRIVIPAYVGLIAGCALLLTACGNKGPLTLPLTATATPAKSAAPKPIAAELPAKPADNNSAPPVAKP